MATFPLVITVLLMLVGVAGSLLPGLPGAPLVWLATVLYGYMEGWVHIRPAYVVLAALSVVVAGVLDAAGGRARTWTGSGAGRLGALVGGGIGLVFLGPLGLIVGPFAGAALLELLVRRRWRPAFEATVANLLIPLGPRRAALLISLLLVLGFLGKVLGGAL